MASGLLELPQGERAVSRPVAASASKGFSPRGATAAIGRYHQSDGGDRTAGRPAKRSEQTVGTPTLGVQPRAVGRPSAL